MTSLSDSDNFVARHLVTVLDCVSRIPHCSSTSPHWLEIAGECCAEMDFVDLVELYDLHRMIPFDVLSLKKLSKAIHVAISRKMQQAHLDSKPLFYWDKCMTLKPTSLSRAIQPFFLNTFSHNDEQYRKEVIFRDEGDGTCSLFDEFGSRFYTPDKLESRFVCKLMFAHANKVFDGTALILYSRPGEGGIARDISRRIDSTEHDFFIVEKMEFDPSHPLVRILLEKNRRIFAIFVELSWKDETRESFRRYCSNFLQ